MNTTFCVHWLASLEVISQVLFTSQQPKKNKMAFVSILSQIMLLFGPLVIQLVWYILKQLFTSVLVKAQGAHGHTPWGICNRALFSIIQSAWSKQRDGCSLAHEIRAADADRFESRISWKSFGGWRLDFEWIFDWMPLKEASTFQFIWCSIWKPGDSNFWVKIGLALERSKMSFPPLSPPYNV